MPIDLSQVWYDEIEKYHYDTTQFRTRKNLRKNLVKKRGPKKGLRWNDFPSPSSCAIRVSIALAKGGVQEFSDYVDRNILVKVYHEKRKEFYATKAPDFYHKKILKKPDIMLKNRLFDGEEKKRQLREKNLKGIIYFENNKDSQNGSHITLWNGRRCHHDDEYFNWKTVIFWKLRK